MIKRIVILVLLSSLIIGCGAFNSVDRAASPLPVVESASKGKAKAKPLTVASPKRQKALPKVPLVVTPEVKKEMNSYLSKNRASIELAMKNREPHLDLMREIFRDEGVPEELINVALLESKFDPTAKSPAGAKGMWQFMKGTAKLYGLEVGMFEDQRKDPVLSTVAAARHLKDLYGQFRDWYLALAAYNAGPASITRAMRNAGAEDFWALARSKSLKSETAQFVPKFIASAIILNNPSDYGFEDEAPVVLG